MSLTRIRAVQLLDVVSLTEKRPLAVRETASRYARNAVLPSEIRPPGYVTYVMCH